VTQGPVQVCVEQVAVTVHETQQDLSEDEPTPDEDADNDGSPNNHLSEEQLVRENYSFLK
jgi:hypothetical protein